MNKSNAGSYYVHSYTVLSSGTLYTIKYPMSDLISVYTQAFRRVGILRKIKLRDLRQFTKDVPKISDDLYLEVIFAKNN